MTKHRAQRFIIWCGVIKTPCLMPVPGMRLFYFIAKRLQQMTSHLHSIGVIPPTSQLPTIHDYEFRHNGRKPVIWIHHEDTEREHCAFDFFDWLAAAQYIDFNDIEGRQAVVTDEVNGYWCTGREEWIETNRCSTYAYEDWCSGILINDWEKILGEYIQSL